MMSAFISLGLGRARRAKIEEEGGGGRVGWGGWGWGGVGEGGVGGGGWVEI